MDKVSEHNFQDNRELSSIDVRTLFKLRLIPPEERQNKDIRKLEEKLLIRRAFEDIVSRIHDARNIKQILVDLKDGICSLFNAHSVIIYVVDKPRNEIYSMLLVRTKVISVRVPINNKSIAGFVASTGKSLNIDDVYDKSELQSINKELTFDTSEDNKTSLKTTQVLAIPICHNNNIMGVIEIINKKGYGGGKFSEYDETLLQEIAEVLGVAFYEKEQMARRRKTKFDYLISQGLLKEEDIESALEEARERKESLEALLMKKYKISREEMGTSFAVSYHCKFVEFDEKIPIPRDLLVNLKKEYLLRELWVPIGKTDGIIQIVIDDPNNILKRDMIESFLKTKSIYYDVAFPEDINKFINHFYPPVANESSLSDILRKLNSEEESEEEDADAITESDSMIMQLVNMIINEAYIRRASDIHIEPNVMKKIVRVRFRVDGDCAVYLTLPWSYRAAIVSLIKIMSSLDITVRRIPQDGKIKFRRPNGDEIELRVATIPTQGYVEDVVLRILAKGDTLPLEVMGISPRNYKEFVKILKKPYGMILVVGPTGSGKTTTLHAALHHINKPDRKIWTAEDPVEITQDGLRQVQVQPKIGFDFAAAMRAFLRADPDVIMVGEMRDFETAKMGVEASLTGHLVFSTLHTNSAPETITRLLDMGVEPLNFADALLGIMAQRLARILCNQCKEAYHPPPEDYQEIVENFGPGLFAQHDIPYTETFTLYRPKGCDLCGKTGYKGRMGIHELLVCTDEIKRLIQKQATVEEIRKTAIDQGMTTLLQDGILKSLQGFTDFKQIIRVCIK